MVWGREGKPASQKRCGQLKAARLAHPGLLLGFNVLLSWQEEASRGVCDDRPAVMSEKKTDSSNAGNHNKVKVMATQLLAKFEENAPAPQTGLKRQVSDPGSKRNPGSGDRRPPAEGSWLQRRIGGLAPGAWVCP